MGPSPGYETLFSSHSLTPIFAIGPYLALAAQLATIEKKEDPLAHEIRELAAGIQEIKNEQEYTIARERSHRNSRSPVPLRANVSIF